ncbi:pilin [Dyella soli]|uniref:Prepilin-type N-terminal cleavage/methylation domain-containing protein n=1 Tax=Dyella soli TaxID=522319 RepID=A0A4R0YQT2_9GAMM|nr:pilin [Dyella soli]TCI10325.1 prepilin-type N-terminal cleavage/methylation domain-containing protein [Dyella soli]
MKIHPTARRQAGFTLIELMIVVAIIAILAALAIPAYQDYLIRTQVMEGFSLAEGPKVAVTEYYDNAGQFPTTQAQAGLQNANTYVGKYVSRVDAVSRPGNILVHFDSSGGQEANAAIGGLQLGFSAVTTNGSIHWVCTNRNINGIPLKYLPTSCR